jgi:VanZ family protein
MGFYIAILILLTIAPPSARPASGVPHHLEHFASFFIAGALWKMGYPRRLLLCLTLAALFAGGLELLQLLVPGRHARPVDFVVDALGAWTGSVAAFAFVGVLAHGVLLRIKKTKRSSGSQLRTVWRHRR